MPIDTVINIAGHLTDRVLCDATGSAMDLAPLYPSQYQFKLKLVDTDIQGNQFLTYPNVTSINASIGLIYAEPRAGTFKLRYGSATATEAIDFKETPDTFREKLAVLAGSTTYGLQEVYQPNPCTWVCHFTDPIDPADAIIGIENELEPETFVRVYQFQEGPEYWVEIRLIQGPIASTNAFDHILAPPPEVRRIREGSTTEIGLEVIIINEVQAVFVPPEFTGTYALKFQGRETTLLSANDGPQVIEDSLNLMFADNIKRFKVTNPELNNAYIEFIGPLSGLPQPLMDVVIGSTGEPDLFISLDLATEEVEAALRTNVIAEATFEVKLHITDPLVPDDPGQDLILFQAPVQILRPLHWDGLAAATPIDWLLPPNPIDYVPFTLDQVITGAQSYAQAFGDGVAHTYNIAHQLASDALIVEVRQNVAGGIKLEEGAYDIVFTNLNTLAITIAGAAPATNSLLISIFACGPKSAFQNHTHTIGQIIGLQELLDDILFRLSALEALLPTAITAGQQDPFAGHEDPNEQFVEFMVEDEANMIPTNRKGLPDQFDPKKPEDLPPAGYLLAAVHDVIELGNFTVNAGTDVITLASTPSPAIATGQRVRINTPQFYSYNAVTFDSDVDRIIYTGVVTPLANGRRVKFTGTLPEALSIFTYYYVINSTSTDFQVSHEIGGDPIPLLTDGGAGVVLTISELPGGLEDSKDYFALTPSGATLQLSETIGGSVVDITDTGITPFSLSTIEDLNIVPPA